MGQAAVMGAATQWLNRLDLHYIITAALHGNWQVKVARVAGQSVHQWSDGVVTTWAACLAFCRCRCLHSLPENRVQVMHGMANLVD